MATGERGMDCVLTVGTDVAAIARDFDPTYSGDTIDMTRRDSGGWRERLQGLKSWTATALMIWIPTDAALQAIWNAYVNGTNLLIRWVDSAGYGRQGNAKVTEFHPNQPLEDGVLVSVSLESDGTPTVVSPGS